MATFDQVLKLLIQADAKGLSAGLNKATGELKNFGGMAQRTFSGINSTFAALGLTLSAGAIGIGLKKIVNGLEELSVSSQKTGIAVEDLAKLRYAFEQADVPVESLNKALRFLNRTIGEARTGNEKAAKSLADLGVAATDAALPAILKIADSIAAIPDAAERAAKLSEVFGKGWEDIVPGLQLGSAELARLSVELEKLGGVPSQKAADAANQLNDNLGKLATSISGPLTVAIGNLLPYIESLSARFVAVASSARGFLGTLEDIGKRVGLGRLIQETRDELDGLREQLAGLRSREAAGDFPLFGGTAELYTQIKQTEEAIARVEQRLVRLRERAGELQKETPAVDVLIQADPEAAAKLTAQATAASQAATAAVPAITVPIAVGPMGAIGNYADLKAEFDRQQIEGFASGGAISGPGTGLSDSILARLSAGEFVVKAAAVKNYGLGFLERLNQMQVPRFASGGPVGTPINIHLDGHSYPMTAQPSVAKELGRLLGNEVLKRGRR